MKPRLEQAWVGWLDSSSWRRLGRSPAGRRVFSSAAFRAADIARRRIEMSVRTLRAPRTFASVQTFCVFLGTVKSGGSLFGALLDAHPTVVLADEADALRYVAAGFRREQLFHVLAKTARREALKGRVTARRLEPYSLAVPGQWQGRFTDIAVIGDSRAGPTTRRLGAEPELLARLRDTLGDVEDRYVHVLRNPFDPISAMVLRGRRTLADAIDDYESQCRRLRALHHRIPADRLFVVRYEDLLAQPEARLAQVCRFLGVDADTEYLSACARIVDGSRTGERRLVRWTPDAVDAVEDLAERYAFLNGYTFEGVAHGRH